MVIADILAEKTSRVRLVRRCELIKDELDNVVADIQKSSIYPLDVSEWRASPPISTSLVLKIWFWSYESSLFSSGVCLEPPQLNLLPQGRGLT